MTRHLEIVCIGAACVDRIYRADHQVLAGTSNPAICTRSFGGVARNVAENLAHLGVSTALCSVVGDDEDGRSLLEHLSQAGVDVHGVQTGEEYPTPSYVAIVGPNGNLFAGASDTRALDALAGSDIARWYERSNDAAWLFLDCNPPPALLRAFIERRPSSSWRLAIDGTSVAKVRHLPKDLAAVDLLFVNEGEYATETARNARATVILRGADGATVVERAANDAGVRSIDIPASEATPVDTTGAGDALVAGTLAALLRGDALERAVRSGMQLAARATENRGAVPSLH